MGTRRMAQVADLIKVEVSDLLRKEMKDPHLGFVTVTEVEVSPDLRHARIFVSVMGSEEETQESLKALSRACGFLRRELGQRIRLRYIPELSFKLDTSIARGDRILRLLREVGQAEEGMAEPGTEEPSQAREQ